MRAEDLRDKVRTAYSSAAEQPQVWHPFPVGRAFAEKSIGYPPDLLSRISSAALDAFAGVSEADPWDELRKDVLEATSASFRRPGW
jgi:hypothetical protein